MNPDYLEVVKQRVENECPICSNKLMISFVITIIIIYACNGFKFNNIFDILLPMSVFIITYIIVGVIGTNMISEKKIRNEYNNVRETYQNYMNEINHSQFEQMVNNTDEGKLEKQRKLPELPTTIPYISVQKSDRLASLYKKIKDEVDSNLIENLENKHASAQFGDGSLGCELDPKMCSSLCASQDKPKDMVAPIPGPQWQPNNAATIQQRIMTGKFVQPSCLQ
tara:strand:- start:3556 stop:4227 length:672 start_codon:yes stop_codon:yes gene_type:complete